MTKILWESGGKVDIKPAKLINIRNTLSNHPNLLV